MALVHDDHSAPPDPGLLSGAVIGSGALAGLLAGVPMLALLMGVGALADEPTAKAGVESSLVTMPNAVTVFTFAAGLDTFEAGFAWETYPGVAIHLVLATAFGALGLMLLAALLGRRPAAGAAVIAGVGYGLALAGVVLLGFVNGVQDVNFVYTAVPEWSWWAGHALYGAVLGMLGAALLRRAALSAEAVSER